MNRCTPHLLGLLFALGASVGAPASAQAPSDFKPPIRPFPPAALRGEMVVLTPPVITLDGQADRLSPGARIRDANNLLVLSGALVNHKVAVNYLRESAGLVHEVWILNSEEIKLKRPNSRAGWFSWGSSGTDAAAGAGATGTSASTP